MTNETGDDASGHPRQRARVVARLARRWLPLPTRVAVASALAGGLLLGAWPAMAQSPSPTSPVGLWRSIDDKTGKPRAEIRITEVNGKLVGRIERSLAADPSKEPAVCTKCPGDRANQPMAGLPIIRAVEPTPTDGWHEGGEILDPESGKLYTLRLRTDDNGAKLLVRGMIGPFYRTQTWERLP